MEDYMEWRKKEGLAKEVPSYPKKITTLYISEEAKSGLEGIALLFDFKKGMKANISKLVEAIGLNQLYVSSSEERDEESPTGLVDPDGLDEYQCFQLGYQHCNSNELPNFKNTELAGGKERSKVFYDAYIRGYTAAFLDKEKGSSSDEPEETETKPESKDFFFPI